ncbi:ataxin-10-like [Diadema setosum]|uniref:ataxin-10-like n=1 Tax=Diadema setosum TaxID=31175 RepID=UPI003B3AA36B
MVVGSLGKLVNKWSTNMKLINHITKENIQQLADLFIQHAETVTEGQDGNEQRFKSSQSLQPCVECIRIFRNSCAQSAVNQDAILSSGAMQAVLGLLKIVTSCPEADEPALVLLRCSIQLLNNLTVSHEAAQMQTWKLLFPSMLQAILRMRDKKASEYSCMLMHTCLQNPACCALFRDSPGSVCIMNDVLLLCCEESDHDFSLLLVQLTLQLPNIMAQVFEHLDPSCQLTLLQIAKSCLEADSEQQLNRDGTSHHFNISDSTLVCFADSFRNMAHHILALATDDPENSKKPQVIRDLLEILCSASALSTFRHTFNQMEFLLDASVELLDILERVGRTSENTFSSSQEFKEPASDGEPSSAAHGFKGKLIQLIGNMCFQCRAFQDRVRDLNGIPVILQQCNIDTRNPYIREWAVLCIRNLCENNVENQAVIASMENQGVAGNKTISDLGIKAVLREDGKVSVTAVEKKRDSSAGDTP